MSASSIRRRIRRAAGGLMAAGAVVAGAVVAWAGLGPVASASATTSAGDWYGYAVTGATYTSTTADWTVPTVSCAAAGAYVAIWTGLDGYSSDTTEQVGTEAYCAGPTPEYFGWYELYPADPVEFSKTLKPGDSLQASVTYKSPDFTLTLRDVTRGWTQTATKALSGAARSSAETVVEVPSTSPFTCPASTLAAFTGDTVDGSPLGSLHPVKVTGANPDIIVSAVDGESFTVSCRLSPG
jgi:Peptidase A4 family